jgi:hypothetical protein
VPDWAGAHQIVFLAETEPILNLPAGKKIQGQKSSKNPGSGFQVVKFLSQLSLQLSHPLLDFGSTCRSLNYAP